VTLDRYDRTSERPGRGWTGRPGRSRLRPERPRGPPSGGRSSSTYQQERLVAFSRYIGSQTVPGPPCALAFKWRPRGLPDWPLDLLGGDAPSTATWSPQSRSRARGRLQGRAGGSRGGVCGSRPHWWTGCHIARWCNGRRYLGSAGGLRLARRSSASAAHGQRQDPSMVGWARPPGPSRPPRHCSFRRQAPGRLGQAACWGRPGRRPMRRPSDPR